MEEDMVRLYDSEGNIIWEGTEEEYWYQENYLRDMSESDDVDLEWF